MPALTSPPIPASHLLGDIYPRNPQIILLNTLPLFLHDIRVPPRSEDDFVVRAHGAGVVPENHDTRQPALRSPARRVHGEGRGAFERGVGDVVGEVLCLGGWDPIREDVGCAFEGPWRGHVSYVGWIGHFWGL